MPSARSISTRLACAAPSMLRARSVTSDERSFTPSAASRIACSVSSTVRSCCTCASAPCETSVIALAIWLGGERDLLAHRREIVRRARDFFRGSRRDGDDARQRFARLIHRRGENAELAGHARLRRGSTGRRRAGGARGARECRAARRCGGPCTSRRRRRCTSARPMSADQPRRAAVGFRRRVAAVRRRHLLRLHGAEPLDVVEQIVDRAARAASRRVCASAVRPRSASRCASAYDTSMADSLLSIDATIATSIAVWFGTVVHLALHVVRGPAVFAERVLRRGVARLEIARSRFDGLGDVRRQRARELRLGLHFDERSA